MKQKRKVKSLIPYRIDKNETLLTLLLLILSVLLCLGSASLMTFSVGAAGNDDFNVTYSGVNDNNFEVLYGLQFLDSEHLGGKPVDELFMDEGALYLAPNQVVFNATGLEENIVDTGKYINVLGGDGNHVYSDNITIIAGGKNIVEVNNDSSSILGGDENELRGNSRGSVPAIIAGGTNNKIYSNGGDVIVGGKYNQISGSLSSFVLGGENNEIQGGQNVIVGGKNVKVNEDIRNIFAFSDSESDFQPESDNAFYLNLTNGVGISTDAVKKGVSVSGSVGFGNINIVGSNGVKCDDENKIGIEGAWDGCLVGCTQVSMDEGKWELLDRGNLCEEKCNDNSAWCLNRPIDTGLEERSDYTGFCVTDHIDISNATRCTTGENESYENVAFETILIDHEDACPTDSNNKCVYRCDPDAHLTGDVAGGSNNIMCYSDCELPWDSTKKIKHNQTVTGYNIEDVSCSNNEYKFPYQIDPKVANGTSPETCGNYDHKKTLICNSGTLYIMKNGKADMGTKVQAENYKYESCNLHNYRCNTEAYNLTQQEIISDKLDGPKNNGSWVVADRKGVLQGVRGQYELCIDYDANPTDPTKNGESCVTNTVSPTPYHYKFKKCQAGYTLYSGVCMKDCKIRKSNGLYEVYRHSETVVGYQATSATCTGVCQAANLVCNDGNWRIGTLDGEQTTQYPYNYCTLNDKVCEGRYNIQESIVNEYGENSVYNYCEPYSGNGNLECVQQSTLYELINCNSGYHTEPGHESRNKWCISNTKFVNCDKPSGKFVGNGRYIDDDVMVEWKGGWNAGYWTNPSECEWTCDEGYHLEGNACVKDWKIEACVHGTKPEHSQYIESGVVIWWINGAWSTPDSCLWSCDDYYIEIGDTCEAEHNCVGSIPNNAYFVTGSDQSLEEDTLRQAYKNSEYEGKKCAYLCEHGYVAIRGKCMKCEEGTWNESDPDVCVLDVSCADPDNYYWDEEELMCLPRGVCLNGYNEYWGGSNLGKINENISDLRPLSGENKNLRCIDADSSSYGNIDGNTCTYSCQEGYYCYNNGDKVGICRVEGCYYNPFYGDAGTYYVGGKPTHTTQGRSWFISVDTGDNAFADSGAFLSYYANYEGCVFWCPEENRDYYVSNDGITRYKCRTFSSRCKDSSYFYGYYDRAINAESYNQIFQYVSANDFDVGGSCLWTCQEGAIPFNGRPRNRNDINYPESLFVKNSVGGIDGGPNRFCFKPCTDDQYLDNYGHCQSCPEGEIVDPDAIGEGVINGVTYRQYRGCKRACPEGQTLVGNACLSSAINGVCPGDATLVGGQCISCVDPGKIPNNNGECVDGP